MAQVRAAPAQRHGRAAQPRARRGIRRRDACMLPPRRLAVRRRPRARAARRHVRGPRRDRQDDAGDAAPRSAGQSGATEAGDVPESAATSTWTTPWIRWSDMPYVCLRHVGAAGARQPSSSPRSRAAAATAIEAEPAIIGVVNPNSPLVWDFLMVDALWAVGRGQPADDDDAVPAGRRDGARSAVAAGLSLQVAEALSGIALVQADAAGRGCFFGSFFPRVDMRSGGPAFGMPESVLGRSPAASSPAATACPSAAAAGYARRTRSTRRRRPRR